MITQKLKIAIFAGLPFALFMAPVLYLMNGWIGVALAAPAGAMFGILLAVFVGVQQNRLDNAVGDEFDGQPVKKKGLANHWLNKESRGGFLILTDAELVFVSHGMNVQNEPYSIVLDAIAKVDLGRSLGVIPNQLVITLTNGDVEKFVLWGYLAWKEAIDAASEVRELQQMKPAKPPVSTSLLES